MTLSRRSLLAAGALSVAAPAVSGALSRGAAAQAARWQFATPYPDANFHTRNIHAFLDDLRERTGGRVNPQLHTNGALLPMAQIKRGVQQRQVQLGEILLSAYGNEDPFFEVDGIPQLVADYPQARRLADLAKPYIEARLQRQGLSLLYTVPWPPGGFYTNAPLTSIEGLRGTRFRTFNVMTNRFATLVGASPALVQAAEVPQAFATGVVNAMVTSAATGVDSAAWDYAKVFTPIGFTLTRNVVIVSRRDLDALSAADRDALRAAAAAAEERGWRLSAETAATTQNTLAQRGLTIAEASPALREGMARISATMTEEWVGRAGEDGRALIAAFRA